MRRQEEAEKMAREKEAEQARRAAYAEAVRREKERVLLLLAKQVPSSLFTASGLLNLG